VIQDERAAQLGGQRLARDVGLQLGGGHGIYPFAQFLPNEQAQNLKGSLEPQRCSHDQDFLQFGWITTLKKCKKLTIEQ